MNVSQFTALADSRALSVAVDSTSPNTWKAWLAYESTKNDVTLVSGSFVSPSSDNNSNYPSWVWQDHTNELNALVSHTTLRFASPFTFYGDEVGFASNYANETYSDLAPLPLLDISDISASSLGQ